MSIDFTSKRQSYEKGELIESQLPAQPCVLLDTWVKEAVAGQTGEPYAFALATCGADGYPAVRTLLMREIISLDDDGIGLIFYSNYDSAKGQDLVDNPKAEALFFWADLERQVRITGTITRLATEKSTAYFASRPKDSQLAAWVSRPQSSVVASRELMDNAFVQLSQDYANIAVPKPDFWGGYLLTAQKIEFWQGRANRMHDRIVYQKTNDVWTMVRLLP